MRYCERARSVCRIDSFRFRFGLLFVFVVVVVVVVIVVGRKDGSEAEAARSSIASIYRIRIAFVSQPSRHFLCFSNYAYKCIFKRCLTCRLTLSIILSIKPPGHGNNSDTARSATQKRVRSW